MCPLSRDTTFDADLAAGQDAFVCSFYFYYRKRGSASYIVREVLSVREREREREREIQRDRERRK